MTTLEALSALHIEGTVQDRFAKYGLAPGCLCCGPGWPCESRALIDRLLEAAANPIVVTIQGGAS